MTSRYMFDAAKRFADKHPGKVISTSLLRPGYHDKLGNKSPGYPSRKDDDKTKRKNAIVAHTVAHLKQKYNATRVLGVGHSGGAIMLGAIIGQQPDLFDAVVLTSMACNIPQWRQHRSGRNTMPRSQSPKKFARNISPGIIIRAIAGKKDHNILPHHTTDCVRLYKKRGADAKAIIVEDAGHSRGLRETAEAQYGKLLFEH
ncbi:alpha/beta hydrolase family protein [Candidatus Spongiihabitans sp.]|uniref:alpha/beta hydrolase family protein n=1 Tax=Candidatus Spongiihabitans sp. TaxID=3101308 RepID=UPI003C7B00B3